MNSIKDHTVSKSDKNDSLKLLSAQIFKKTFGSVSHCLPFCTRQKNSVHARTIKFVVHVFHRFSIARDMQYA
jgi:hypothetical protein